jgi:hypothetical protein
MSNIFYINTNVQVTGTDSRRTLGLKEIQR